MAGKQKWFVATVLALVGAAALSLYAWQRSQFNMVKTLDLYWFLLNQDPDLEIRSVTLKPVPEDQIQAE